MSNHLLRRACVRALMNHLTQAEEGRPVALGCKLMRSKMTVDDVAIIWARLGEELRQRGTPTTLLPPGDWGPLRDLLVEYRAVMRERVPAACRRTVNRSCAGGAERRASDRGALTVR
jgi:hypothetical protein